MTLTKSDVSVGDTLYTITEGYPLEVVHLGALGDTVHAMNTLTGRFGWYHLSRVRKPTDTTATGQTHEETLRTRWNRELLKLAAECEIGVSFGYKKPSGEVSWRTIEPHTVTATRAGNECVVGEDESGDVKAFRLDRIQGYAETD